MQMISAETMEELLVTLKPWKSETEKKGLRVNMEKTKIMVSDMNLNLLKTYGKDLSNMRGNQCNILCWIHKICNGIKDRLHHDPDFRCAR